MSRFFSSSGVAGEGFFRLVRGTIRIFVFRWLRLNVVGIERLQVDGKVIIAPVHRSNLDGPLIGSSSHRRVRYLAKESLFRPRVAGWSMRSLGCFPVRRGEADLDAMRVAKSMLNEGDAMLIFPEGTRQDGDDIGEIFDGTAWLSAKTGAPVVPVGIVGTYEAMPAGTKVPKRVPVFAFVGEALDPPSNREGGPAKRSDMTNWTAELKKALEDCQREARALASKSA